MSITREQENHSAWIASWQARLSRRPLSRRAVTELLEEASGFRFASLMAYVSHREMRMDTDEEERLRLRVVAKLRDLLGISFDDDWQATGPSRYAELAAERDQLRAELAAVTAERDQLLASSGAARPL